MLLRVLYTYLSLQSGLLHLNVAIYYLQVRSAVTRGDYATAESASRVSYLFNKFGIATGIIVVLLTGVLAIIGFPTKN